MKNDKCKILWDFTVQRIHEIYGIYRCSTAKNKKSLPDDRFCLP